MTPYSLGELAAARRADLLADAHDAVLARAARLTAPPQGPAASVKAVGGRGVLRRLLPGRRLRPRPTG